jgi:predicted Rossmann fold nucleotide-binding protein DprA/Smf involved in DNA uptake
VADFLDEKVKEIDARLSELKPLVDEYERLSKAREALSGVGGTSARAATTTRRTRARRGSAARRGGGGGGRRGRRGGTRATQTLELVRSKPGISIPELAQAMGIQPNYLYRVLPGLEKEGQIKREGRGWHPA